MGFRINRGIFQFKDAATETFINKFKIDDRDGALVEVDADGNAVTGYLKVGEKASDSDLLDGINSSAFLRSNTADTASARIDFTADESIRFKGARGQFTNEYIHLYNKVGIGHPSGWGQGQSDTPDKGISTYGGANFAYGNNAQSAFKGSLRIDANWGNGDFSEAFTIRGTYPSIALRSTTHDSKWLIHNDNQLSYYYGSAVDTTDWGLKFRIATNGNLWMSWAGGWLSDLLNAKEDSGVAQVAVDAAKEELLTGAIATAQTTADNAATAAATAQTTADTALARADAAKGDTVVIGEIATAAQAAADAAQATADGKLGATAKAADSNLLDGIDSSAFLRSNAADTFTGTLTMGTQKALVANNYGRGVYGIYSATRYQHVWSMGTAYNLADNGTGAGNLYGIAWTHQNIGGESISGLGHQMLIMSNGDTRSAIGDGIWTKYNIYASGGNSTEWNAAYDWGNHAGLYDTVGSAAGVNTRIDDEIVPQITANTDAIINNRNEITTVAAAAAAAQSTADGKANASHDHDRLYISDTRGAARAPSYYNDRYAQWDFQNESDTGITAGDTWQALLTVSKWSVFDPSHKQEQLIFTGDNLYRRTATSDTAWGTSKKIWDSGNFDPSSKANTSHDHNDLYYTKAQSNANYDAAGSASTAQTNAINAANVRIDDEVFPAINTNATNIARNATDIATKAALGGSYAQDFAADDMRVDQWFRNTASGKGLYNEATTQHFYSDDDDYWNVAGGTGANGIRFRDEHAGTIRGYVYANSSNQVGLLDAGGSWAVRHFNDHGTYFYTDDTVEEFKVGRDAVTGDYGTVQVSSNRGGWGGYSIYGQYVLMSNGSRIGIYNDLDNEWMLQCYRNAQTELYHNGSRKLYTNSGGINVEGTVTATSFSGSGAGLTNLPIPDQSIPVSINGAAGNILVSMNMNLDMGQIEFTLSNGQTFTAMMGR